MKRRNFVKYALLTAAAGAPFIGCNEVPREKKLSLPKTLSQVYDEKTMLEIGRAYGKAKPREYERETLLKILDGGEPNPSKTSFAEATEQLDKQTRSDFVHGETVLVNGYILSITEARQCALLSLLTR